MPVMEIIRDTRTREEKMAEPMYELDGYWCLNEDKTAAVIEGHPDARFVLGGPGSKIPMADAIKYGLVGASAPAEPEAAPDPEPEPVPAPKKGKAKPEEK